MVEINFNFVFREPNLEQNPNKTNPGDLEQKFGLLGRCKKLGLQRNWLFDSWSNFLQLSLRVQKCGSEGGFREITKKIRWSHP